MTALPVVRWSDAVGAARRIIGRCSRASMPDVRRLPAVPEAPVELWGLPIYALAHQTGQPVQAVTATQLRYRLHDRNQYTTWLFEQLSRMGHQVDRPTYPDWLGGRRADVHAAHASSNMLGGIASPQADDPVVQWWRLVTLFTADTTEMSDGTLVTDPATCTLWSCRPEMISQLDALLVCERGGWQAGTRVRTHGVPHYISPLGQLAGACGVSPDRAIVGAPSWDLDDGRQTLADGPAAAYFLRFRNLDDNAAATSPYGPVRGEHLALDLDPFPGPAGPQRVMVPARPPAWPAHADEITQPPAAADHQGGLAPDGVDELPPDDLRADRPRLPRSMANTDDPFRAAAICRVWELRDTELRFVGDSEPRRIAERIAAGSYPEPAPSRSSRELRSYDAGNHTRSPRPRAPWCEPNQQLVTGRPRRELLQWLEAMDNATSAQCRKLDALEPDCDIAAARRLLAEEGFIEVLDVRGNVDSGRGDVDLVCVNADAGFIATVTGSDPFGRGTQLWSISVAYNVAALDEELVLATRCRGGAVVDSDRRATNLMFGMVTVRPPDSWPHRSLRTDLAVLRAFARPVTPWIYPVSIMLGTDDVPDDERRGIIARLPQEVHELFGPLLTPGRARAT